MELLIKESECYFANIKEGDHVHNAYPFGHKPGVFRINCPRCSSGYVDVTATEQEPIDGKSGRFNITVGQEIYPVRKCGKAVSN